MLPSLPPPCSPDCIPAFCATPALCVSDWRILSSVTPPVVDWLTDAFSLSDPAPCCLCVWLSPAPMTCSRPLLSVGLIVACCPHCPHTLCCLTDCRLLPWPAPAPCCLCVWLSPAPLSYPAPCCLTDCRLLPWPAPTPPLLSVCLTVACSPQWPRPLLSVCLTVACSPQLPCPLLSDWLSPAALTCPRPAPPVCGTDRRLLPSVLPPPAVWLTVHTPCAVWLSPALLTCPLPLLPPAPSPLLYSLHSIYNIFAFK